MINPPRPGFTGGKLDRLDHVREDAAALAALRTDPRARLLLLDGLDPVLGTDQASLSWTPLSEAPGDAEFGLLGTIDAVPHFVMLAEPVPQSGRSTRLWSALSLMPADQAATYAAARSLVDWHMRHRFCANCGTSTKAIRAGWARQCAACNAQHFPRTDPVVIMLAEHEGRVLVGRQPEFPADRYSALAGFVEVGESIEEAVIRELKEEAGVVASNVRYVGSQPWPFPSSLMMACVASADSDAITLDTNELESAMWCDRADIAAVLANAPGARFIAPPPFAIAHTLLTYWLETQP